VWLAAYIARLTTGFAPVRYPVPRRTRRVLVSCRFGVVFSPRSPDFAGFARPAGRNHAIVTTLGDLPISEFLIIGSHHGSLKRIS
jgi:hypothetical protein